MPEAGADTPYLVTQTLKSRTGAPWRVVRFNAGGDYALSGSGDKEVCLWNPHKGVLLQSYLGHGKNVYDVAVTKDNAKFASAGDEKYALIWDVAKAAIVRKCNGHNQRINCVAFNHNSEVLATGSYDMTVMLWDMRANGRAPIQTLKEAQDSVTAVKMTANAIVTASVDGAVRIYDLRSGKQHTDWLPAAATHLAVTGDAKCILASCIDGKLCMLDAESGGILNEYRGLPGQEARVECNFADNERYVVAGASSGDLHLWDIVESDAMQVLTGHTKAITSLDYHTKNSSLLTASMDGTLKLWGKQSLEK